MTESYSPVDRDKWEERRDVEYKGVIGTWYKHEYNGNFAASGTDLTLASFDLEEGDNMPDRPTSSTATIEKVTFGRLEAGGSRRIVVEGFEAKAWED